MKIAANIPLYLAVGISSFSWGAEAVSPFRLQFDQLQNQEHDLRQALLETGMVSIQGTPLQNSVYNAQQECFQALQDSKSSTDLSTVKLAQGTVLRSTVATQTIDNEMIHSLPSVCSSLQAASQELGFAVDRVNQGVLRAFDEKFSLSEASGEMKSLMKSAETLEHFHSYTPTGNDSSKNKEEPTIALDVHTDDGLFLAFTPARWAKSSTPTAFSMDDPHEGIWVENRKTGELEPLELTEEDQLVILLGQAVERLPVEETRFRAVPHALVMPSTMAEGDVRLWYGRMVVPDAKDLLADFEDEEGFSTHRMLQNQTIEDCDLEAGEYFCWHKCFKPMVEFNVTTDSCAAMEQSLGCANECGHIWGEEEHNPIWQPRCVEEFALVQTDGLECIDGVESVDTDTTSSSPGFMIGSAAVFSATLVSMFL